MLVVFLLTYLEVNTQVRAPCFGRWKKNDHASLFFMLCSRWMLDNKSLPGHIYSQFYFSFYAVLETVSGHSWGNFQSVNSTKIVEHVR